MIRWVLRLFRRPPEILPPPDRSVYRGAYLADKQARYISRVTRQG